MLRSLDKSYYENHLVKRLQEREIEFEHEIQSSEFRINLLETEKLHRWSE